eukprot:m.379727 g.379727  ORF g.379727 m.379727 type:complete len:50 (+) comp99863_c0_seq1:27-176(+)
MVVAHHVHVHYLGAPSQQHHRNFICVHAPIHTTSLHDDSHMLNVLIAPT